MSTKFLVAVAVVVEIDTVGPGDSTEWNPIAITSAVCIRCTVMLLALNEIDTRQKTDLAACCRR